MAKQPVTEYKWNEDTKSYSSRELSPKETANFNKQQEINIKNNIDDTESMTRSKAYDFKQQEADDYQNKVKKNSNENTNIIGDRYKKGGKVRSSASKRADGCCTKGFTRA